MTGEPALSVQRYGLSKGNRGTSTEAYRPCFATISRLYFAPTMSCTIILIMESGLE